jgi:hypothetical protein
MSVVLSRTEVEALLPGGCPGSGSSWAGDGNGLSAPGETFQWPVSTLQRLESRLESAAAELAEAVGERIAGSSDDAPPGVSFQYLGLAPGARLPGRCETVGTWVIQGPRPRESGRIAIEASLAVGLVGGLLGSASGSASADPDRQLSGLERSLLTRVVELIAAVLLCVLDERDSRQWEAARAELSVRAETARSPAAQRTGSVLAGFGCQLADCQGLVHVELSTGFVERLTEPDASEVVSTAGAAAAAGLGTSTPLVVQMPVRGLGQGGLEGLALGDVILTGRAVDAETGEANWDVRVDGVCRFEGHPGTFDGARAVVLEPWKRVE